MKRSSKRPLLLEFAFLVLFQENTHLRLLFSFKITNTEEEEPVEAAMEKKVADEVVTSETSEETI